MRFFRAVYRTLVFHDRFLFRHFLLLYSVHVWMKLFLGLYLVDKLDYTSPLLFPPLSILLTGADIIMVFLLVKIGRLFRRFTVLFFVYEYALFIPVYYYAIKSYIIYLYFHGFVNYGLDMFLGANGNETVNFVLFALDVWGWLFLIALVFSAAVYLVFFRRPGIPSSSGEKRFMVLVNSAGLASLLLTSFLPNTVTGSIEKNPVFEVGWTYMTMPGCLDYYRTVDTSFSPRKSAEDNRYTADDARDINVLVILIESLSAQTIYSAKDGREAAPELLDIMSRSFRFSSYRTFFPGSTRSIIGMLCGSFASTGWRSVTRYRREIPCTSLTGILGSAGYRTGFFTPVSMAYDRLGESSLINRFDSVVDADKLRERYVSKKKFGTGNAVEEELAIRALETFVKTGDEPFFAVQYMYWTHAPYEHPFRDTGGLNNRERYLASLSYVDSAVKKIFDVLERTGAEKDTMVFITADHGQAFGEHPGNYTHSNYLYDESIRIPLILYHPEGGGAVVERRGTHADFAPTVLDMLGRNAPSEWQGVSLFSASDVSRPDLIFTRAIQVHNGVISGRWKFFYNLRTGQEYLFDLASDPDEHMNRAAEHPEKCRDLKTFSDSWAAWQQWFFLSGPETLKN